MSESTISTRLRHMRTVARGLPVSPEQATGDDLITWVGFQRWEPETRHAYYISLRQFFAHIRPDDNPASGLPRVRRPAGAPRPTPENIYAAALSRADSRTRLILLLAGGAGLRRSEIVTIHTTDLIQDLTGWSLIIRGKGNKRRIVPIAETLASAVRLQFGSHDSEWLFPSKNDGHISGRWAAKLASRVLPPRWSLHTLRHRFATMAYAADRDLLSVQQLLGHASVATTQRYTRVPDGALRRAASNAIEPLQNDMATQAA